VERREKERSELCAQVRITLFGIRAYKQRKEEEEEIETEEERNKK
jgi:hypothetical protein